MAEPGAIGEAAALDGSVNSQNDAAAADEGATITEDVTNIDINHKDSLQTLPAELIAEIISHGIGSLEAFRLTCRALRNASQYKWNVRYNGPLRVRFITGDLQRTVSALATSGCLEKMNAVVFAHLNGAERYAAQKAGKFSEEQAAEFSLLLESLLRELPNLESVAMYDYSGNNLDARASGRALLLLPVLAEVKPSKLEVVTLSGADLPSSLLRSFLQAFEDNLRSLRMEEVRTCDFTMDSTLAFIRDRLRMEFLRIGDMQDVVHSNQRVALDNHFGDSGREHKWFRSKLGGELEHYSMGSGWVQAKGEGAVKLALNRVLQLEGSSLYDASLTKEALGL